MKVQGIQCIRKPITIEVSPREVYQNIRSHLLSKLKLPDDSRIEGDKIIVEEEYHTSHSYFVKNELKDTSPEQYEALTIILQMDRLVHKVLTHDV